jgi:tetratricopeptide (TPR) repeat protein
MAAKPKAAPLDELQNLRQTGSDNPILQYYQGVAALRKGDLAAAHLAWSAAAHTLATVQLNENLLHLRRDLAVQYAQEGRWREIVQIYESTIAAPGELPPRPEGASTVDPVLAEMAGLAYYQLGYTAAQMNEWSQAVGHWRSANSLMSSRALAQNLALAEEALGNWAGAATAWRDMIRRRPRKADHPDALSDAQVAAIWQHIAQCYQQVDDSEEVITCLRNAIKYAPDDLDLRINLVDVLKDEGRVDAAENEVERILEQNADHLPALLRLGFLYTGRWGRDPKPIWEHVLQLDPSNSDAQEALALIYLGLATNEPNLYSHPLTMEHRTLKKALGILETGLKVLPEHPLLLTGMGQLYRQHKQDHNARQAYERAIHSALARKNLKLIDLLLHELLHVDGDQVVRALAPEVNRFPGLLARFWVEQGERVMNCELGEQWAKFFWDEAVRLAESSPGSNSLAATLLHVFDMAFHENLRDLARTYEARLRAQPANSGAIEYVDATYLHESDPNKKKAVLARLRQAKTAAQKSREPDIVEMIESFEDFLRRPPNLFDGVGPGLIFDLLKNLNKDELDDFRRLF